ncbi:MAG TPA: terminase [Limnobacter sp.]|nr:terminase [Limnobacter sp.]
MSDTEAQAAEIEALRERLSDPVWRLTSGALYNIVTKGQDGDDDLVVPFKPNRFQRRLLTRLHNRNLILKARQLGMTTMTCVLWLDTALFSSEPVKCGVIAQNREAAEEIFRDKIIFVYDHLPEPVKAIFPLRKRTESQVVFDHNGSSIKVATSMRSGTIHRLLVSEFGKICAESPKRAREVDTGSIPAVPIDGLCVIESTAEGEDGSFYKKCIRAMEIAEEGRPLTKKDYRFFFFPWWENPEYEIDAEGVVFSVAMLRYFKHVESIICRPLSERKRAWYQVTVDSDFNGEQPLAWQEYPSYPMEAFQRSTEGCWYAAQIAKARSEGRICNKIPVEQKACFTFWDIGRGDMTAIWVMQKVGVEHRFIRYYEATGEDLDHYAAWLQDTGLVFDTHYIPHETNHRRMGKSADTNQTIKEMLEELLPGHNFEVVPAPTTVDQGIKLTRKAFASSWFCQEGCGQGIKRLSSYKKHWDQANGRFTDVPVHNDDSHGADGFRQFGQELARGNLFVAGTRTDYRSPGARRPTRFHRRSGMAV